MANLGGSKVAGGSPPRGKPPATPIRPRVGSGVGADASGSTAGRSGGLGLGLGAERSGSGGSSGRSRGRVGVADLEGKATDLVAGLAGEASGLEGKKLGVSAGAPGAPSASMSSRGADVRSRELSEETGAGCSRVLTEVFPVVGSGLKRDLAKGGGPSMGSGSGQGVSLGAAGVESVRDTAEFPRQQPVNKVAESNRLFWEAKNERI